MQRFTEKKIRFINEVVTEEETVSEEPSYGEKQVTRELSEKEKDL